MYLKLRKWHVVPTQEVKDEATNSKRSIFTVHLKKPQMSFVQQVVQLLKTNILEAHSDTTICLETLLQTNRNISLKYGGIPGRQGITDESTNNMIVSASMADSSGDLRSACVTREGHGLMEK